MPLRDLLSLPLALALFCAAVPAQADTAPGELAPQRFAQLGDLKLERGGTIEDCALGYRTVGTLNAERSNAVLLLTWRTGKSAQALGLLKPEGLFDPSPYYVIIVDSIGNGVSCSPSNSRTQKGPAFPAFTIRDMVEAEHRLVTKELKLTHLHAVLGYSMGGTQTFQWMVSHPDMMDVAVPIAGTPRQSSYDLLLFSALERAILSDPGYAGGAYTKNPTVSLYKLLFSLHATTPAHRNKETARGEVDEFLQATTEIDPAAVDANDSLWQIRAMMTQDIGEPGTAGPERSLDVAAARIKARVHVISAAQDQLLNPNAALDFAKTIHASTTVLQTDCGHLALRCELAPIRAAVETALKSGRQDGSARKPSP